MLRINTRTTADDEAATLLGLEGEVAGPWVEELRRVCNQAIGNSRKLLVLDLAGVFFIDADGVALFRELAARRVTVTNGSPFVAEQLKEVFHVSR